jgi:hypothetical protein
VTGYGSGEDYKAPAGWDEPFAESGGKAVFRAAIGARQFYQIDDNAADADIAYINAFESMSDVNTGAGQWASSRYFGKWYSLADSTHWVVVADEKTCYVWLCSRYGLIPHGFGEFDSNIEGDTANSFIAGHNSASSLPYNLTYDCSFGYAVSLGGTSIAAWICIHKSAIGTNGVVGNLTAMLSANTCPGGGSGFSDTSGVTGMGYRLLPMPIHCSYADEGNSNMARGILRGLASPSTRRPEANYAEVVDPKTSKTWMALLTDKASSTSTNYIGQLFVDISGSWD